jgi:DNA-binding response OmpR family regulator
MEDLEMSDVHITVPAIRRSQVSEPATGGLMGDREMEGDRGRVLLVGGDANLGRVLLSQLRADGHCAEFASTADRAASLAGVRPPRLVVLGDLDPPRGALDLLEKIRERHTGASWGPPWREDLPVIVLSSDTEELDLLRAFEAGADDFIARPVRYLELRARLRALLRRVERAPHLQINVGPLTIDTDAYTASLHGQPLQLHRLEYELLLHLAGDPGACFANRSC